MPVAVRVAPATSAVLMPLIESVGPTLKVSVYPPF
jgi:hypothetical protein